MSTNPELFVLVLLWHDCMQIRGVDEFERSAKPTNVRSKMFIKRRLLGARALGEGKNVVNELGLEALYSKRLNVNERHRAILGDLLKLGSPAIDS